MGISGSYWDSTDVSWTKFVALLREVFMIPKGKKKSNISQCWSGLSSHDKNSLEGIKKVTGMEGFFFGGNNKRVNLVKCRRLY